jgi:predicted HNH restriction endonuclease
MDLSEVLLHLDLMRKQRRRPELAELNFMLYFLENYNEVKEFYRRLQEYNFRPPFVFYNDSLIHFIEDYEDCVNLKNNILTTQRKRKRRYSILFIQQIMLSKTEQDAINIMQEAKKYGIELGEAWASGYDSMWQIKKDQKAWKEGTIQLGKYNRFDEIYDDYLKMKSSYFENISLEQLKQTILKKQETENNHKKVTQSTVYDRNVLIKEFAKRVANGYCQLCENEAPFNDKHGNPFLEVHHIKYLSQGGSDSIDNVVALCPNCHRKMHLLELEEDINRIKSKALSNMSV